MRTEALNPSLYFTNRHEIDWNSNPNRQSGVLPLDDNNVLIVRPQPTEFNTNVQMTRKFEVERRKAATELHKKELPAYTLRNRVYQDYWENTGGAKIPMIIRLTQRMYDIQTIAQIPMEDLVRDVQVCRALADIYEKHLNLTNRGFHFDVVGFVGFGKAANQVTNRVFLPYKPSNIMVGYDFNGNRRIFCDPDWYVTTKEYLGSSKGVERIKRLAGRKYHLAKSAAFYKAAAFTYKCSTF